MQLEQALSHITEIRSQISRTETFRGYRALTIGFSGVLGIVAAVVQAVRLPPPAILLGENGAFEEYLWLWGSVAVVSLAVVGAELAWSCWLNESTRNVRLTRLAVEQFLPCIVAGAVLTLVLPDTAPQVIWMFPGLWAILFSLGIFASCRLLPPATFWMGVYYLAAGTYCLWLGDGRWALSPWLMGVTFGGGQLLTAGILYWTLERQP